GLAAVKNVGEAAMQAAIEERAARGEFKPLEDFCARLDSRKANKKVLESLVKCGAFDFAGNDRAELFAMIDWALATAAASQRDQTSGQESFLKRLDSPESRARPIPRFPAPKWTGAEKLAFEKELLGFYVTGHPLDEYRAFLESGNFRAINSLAELDDRATVRVAGAFVAVEKRFT